MLLRLYIEALGAATQMVLNRTATIGICGPLDVEVAGLERVGVGSVELIPVAAPDHPLARAGRNAPGAGHDHIQLVLTDRSLLTQGQDRGVIGTQTWRLAGGSKHMLLKEGPCLKAESTSAHRLDLFVRPIHASRRARKATAQRT